jgi:hypothetical protein
VTQVAEAFVRIRPDTDGFGRELRTDVNRDVRRLEQSVGGSNRELARFSRGALVGTGALGGLGRAAAFASLTFIGGAGLTYALKSTVDAAVEAEVVQGQLENALDSLGISFEDNRAAIENRTQALSQMAGIDDELLTRTFVNFARRTGDVTKALRLNEIAVNVARGRNISLEASAALVTRASLGMAGALRRVGIEARAGASATELLDLLQRKYAGSAEAYGNTAAGAQERFRVALENTQEVIGAALLPSLTRILTKATDWLNNQENQERVQKRVNQTVSIGERILGGLADTYEGIATVYRDIKDADPFGGASGTDMVRKLDDIFQASKSVKSGVDDINGALERFGINARNDSFTLMAQRLEGIAAAAEHVAAAVEGIEATRATGSFLDTDRSRVDIPGVKGTQFAGPIPRELTPQEQLAIALAGDPNNISLLQQARAAQQRRFDFATQMIDEHKGNTAKFAAAAAEAKTRITSVTDQIAAINAQTAAAAEAARRAAQAAAEKAERARLELIERTIPNQVRGVAEAAAAFASIRELAIRQIGAVVGRTFRGDTPDIDRGVLGQAAREAELRRQIAEQTVKKETGLIPFLQRERAAVHRQLVLTRSIGATKEERLNLLLEQATLDKRIRDIREQNAKDKERFGVQDLFSQAAGDFARLASNIAPIAVTLSPQEAGGAAVRAARSVTVQQHFYGERPDPAQAVQQASQAARALR